MYEKLERLAATAQTCAFIFGNLETADFVLMPITGAPIRPMLEVLMRGPRQLRLCGVIGLVDGAPRTALSEPLADKDIRELAELFVEHCCLGGHMAPIAERVLERVQRDMGSFTWLEALHALPDTR